MADIVSQEVRSRMMAGIRGKNTKPELLVRSGLHRLGFRFRLHNSGLPGRPDIVLPKWNAVIFVNGCFWHGHDCGLFKLPLTRKDFWHRKISGNRERDHHSVATLRDQGWRVAIVWECALKGPTRRPPANLIADLAGFLKAKKAHAEFRGG